MPTRSRPRTHSLAVVLAGALATACDGAGSAAGARGSPDGGTPPPADASADQGAHDEPLPATATKVPAGDASGSWCGPVEVQGDVTVPDGATLTVCAGSDVRFVAGARLRVDGTLALAGTDAEPVALGRASDWSGLRVAGTLTAAHAEIENAMLCVQGLTGSEIALTHTALTDCDAPASFANGGELDHVTVRGGTSVQLSGGVLSMADSLLDMERPESSPDCVIVGGGALSLDHTRVTGCHCPLHVNSATAVTLTDSVFDGAAVAVMIRSAAGSFTRNHFLGSAIDLQDIGGGLAVTLSDNYYGGGAATITSGNLAQFTGAGAYRTDPVPGAGPRP